MDILLFQHEKEVEAKQAGKRLDTFLLALPFKDFDPGFSPSRSALQKWISEGFVEVNGAVCTDKSRRVRRGDRVSVRVEIPRQIEGPPPEPLNIRIVHRDPHLLVIDKPPGVSSHPVPGSLRGSVVNFLLQRRIPLPLTSHPLRPGIVHRLDKNTSGLMLVACTDLVQTSLIEMIKRRQVDRRYLAIVFGRLPLPQGTVETSMKRHPKDRRKMMVSRDRDAMPARTHYRVLKRYPGFSHLSCSLDTGRTHQIRVHLSHLGYPVAGDPLYGGRRAHERVKKVLKGMSKRDPDCAHVQQTLETIADIITEDDVHLLHAARISFPHPVNHEPMVFTASPHEKFLQVMGLLETLPHEEVSDGV